MNTYQLVRIKYIGGQQDPATNAASTDQRFNGYMWGFNVSQANTADTRVLSGDGMTFFTKFAIIAKAMVGTDDWVASDFNVPTSRTPATAANIFEVEQALNSRQIGVSYSNQNNISNVAGRVQSIRDNRESNNVQALQAITDLIDNATSGSDIEQIQNIYNQLQTL